MWQVKGRVHRARQGQGHCAAVAQPVQASCASMSVIQLACLDPDITNACMPSAAVQQCTAVTQSTGREDL